MLFPVMPRMKHIEKEKVFSHADQLKAQVSSELHTYCEWITQTKQMEFRVLLSRVRLAFCVLDCFGHETRENQTQD